jgi:hypothetical protein
MDEWMDSLLIYIILYYVCEPAPARPNSRIRSMYSHPHIHTGILVSVYYLSIFVYFWVSVLVYNAMRTCEARRATTP